MGTCIGLYGICELHLVEDADTAVAYAFITIGLKWMAVVVSIAAVLGTSISCFTSILPIPRILAE